MYLLIFSSIRSFAWEILLGHEYESNPKSKNSSVHETGFFSISSAAKHSINGNVRHSTLCHLATTLITPYKWLVTGYIHKTWNAKVRKTPVKVMNGFDFRALDNSPKELWDGSRRWCSEPVRSSFSKCPLPRNHSSSASWVRLNDNGFSLKAILSSTWNSKTSRSSTPIKPRVQIQLLKLMNKSSLNPKRWIPVWPCQPYGNPWYMNIT